jgi:tetratricopeptide (TPR) repeat protein
METKKQQLNFWSKLAETDICSLLLKTVNTRSFLIIAVCVFLSAFSGEALSSINSGRIYQLQQRIINNPGDTETMLHLAMEYGLQNNFVKAVETYFDLLRIDPDNFHAYNNLGILYKKSGQFRDSLHCYQQAARINPDSYWVPYNMGLCYEAMGRMQEARESYGRALSLNPGFAQALQRLRNLTDPDSSPALPVLPGVDEAQIYLVDGKGHQPRIYNPQQAKPRQPVKEPELPKMVKKSKPEPEVKISEKIEKQKKAKKKIVKTTREGAAAQIFNQAMEMLEKNDIERAVEFYCRSIIAERELLSEPDNGLIKKGLEFLIERPNRMPEGQFFRGFLITVSGNPDLAIPDLKTYIEKAESQNKDNELFVKEARRMVERYEAIVAEREARAQVLAEEQAAAAEAVTRQETPVEPEEPRASDFVVKRMATEEILSEADRLTRSGRQKDAIAVLKVGLESEPDNIQLLMKSANAYTELLIMRGDQEAGKMALLQFEKIAARAPQKSREWGVAREMVEELQQRLR